MLILVISRMVVEAKPREVKRWDEGAGGGGSLASPEEGGDGPTSEKRRRRKSRWEPVDDTIVEQKELQTRLDTITRTINTNTIPVDEICRPPSPEPIYDARGKRINTRMDRARDILEEERHRICERLRELNPSFRQPPGMRPLRAAEKIYVPVKEHPELNFIGLILGPRGNTHKRLEKDFDCRVAIRGKGSVKDGRHRGPAAPDDNDDLHVVVSAEGPDAKQRIKACLDKVRELITPMEDEKNDHKQAQLRELAQLNGTLRT